VSLLAVYRRGTLRMPPWEAMQIGLGLMIVPLILIHVIGTRAIGFSEGFEPSYAYVVASIWVSDPIRGAQQAFALVVVWEHSCVGLHFWLRHRPWYPRLLPILYPVVIVVPILALLGFAAMGATVAERAQEPSYLASVFADLAGMSAETIAWFKGLEIIGIGVFLALVAFTLIAREARRFHRNRFGVFRATLPDGRVVVAPLGQTVLEALRDSGVPHAAVCGGRDRCTTCRIDVGAARESLAAPEATEAKAITRIRAEAGVRLACQIRPTADLAVVPLLPPDVSARDANRPGGIQGREQPVVSMFIDMRGSTRLGEEKMPFDVLFILNRFFAEMAEALTETKGHYAQFAGDGLMALYGVRGEAGADRRPAAPRPNDQPDQGPSPAAGADQRVGTGGSLE
jgi:adenylate cyclase